MKSGTTYLLSVIILLLISLNTQSSYSDNPIQSNVWYITTQGDNQNDCMTPQTPCTNIETVLALPNFISNDTIMAEGKNFYYEGDNEIAILIDKDVIISGGWSIDFTHPLTRPTSFIGYQHIGLQIEPNVKVSMANVVATGGEYDPSQDMGETFQQSKIATKGGIRNFGHLSMVDSRAVGYFGYAISNSGTLTATQSTFTTDYGTNIENNGSLYLIDSQVSGADTDVGCAGISNSGTLVMENSLIYYNRARYGDGGLCNSGEAIVRNSRILDNVSMDTTPYASGGIVNFGTLWLTNSVVASNYQSDLYNGGTVYLANSTLIGDPPANVGAQNASGGVFYSRNSVISGCRGLIQSDGYNLLGSTDRCDWQAAAGDILDRAPQLDGAYSPRAGSRAINGGNPAGCLAWDGTPLDTDGRGVARVGVCDIGAYEYEGQVFLGWLPLLHKD